MKKIVQKNPERVWYLEYLRIIATVAVIVLHVAAQNFYGVGVESFAWKVFNCANGLVRWSVPIFLTISGALFLDNEKEITIETICKAVDINPSTWWRMVNGSIKKPKFETLARICKLLDIDINDLIN